MKILFYFKFQKGQYEAVRCFRIGNTVHTNSVFIAETILPNIFDTEIAAYIRKHLKASGMKIRTSVSVEKILGADAVTGVAASAGELPADLVILSFGIRPATAFLKDTGLAMENGTILTDEKLATNIPDVYAVGDCAMVKNRLTGARQWSAMGSTANIAARAMAKAMYGAGEGYIGCLGTGVIRLASDMNAGRTGLTEEQAKAAGFNAVSVLAVQDDKAHYYPDASSVHTWRRTA